MSFSFIPIEYSRHDKVTQLGMYYIVCRHTGQQPLIKNIIMMMSKVFKWQMLRNTHYTKWNDLIFPACKCTIFWPTTKVSNFNGNKCAAWTHFQVQRKQVKMPVKILVESQTFQLFFSWEGMLRETFSNVLLFLCTLVTRQATNIQKHEIQFILLHYIWI